MNDRSEDGTSVIRSTAATVTRPPVRSQSGVATASSLLVIDRNSARVVTLPPMGELIIGRAPECELALPDSSVSRKHARLTVTPDEISLIDLDSHNGTRVSNIDLRAGMSRALCDGDVIAVGEYTLVLHRRAAPMIRTALRPPMLRGRIEEEIDRAHRADRVVALLCCASAAAPDESRLLLALTPLLRLSDAVCFGLDGDLVLVLPERASDEIPVDAARLLAELAALWPGVRAGLSRFPDDGGNAEALLSAARAAAALAQPGDVMGVERTALTFDLGGQRVVLADPAMLRLYALLERLAQSDLPVLLNGETGTGKEVAAAIVHHRSPRRDRPFVALNCGAIPENLFESELFGYERGAFSGAAGSKRGHLEAADGGTLFLDEVGELLLSAQVKLLRVLESGRLARLGDTRERAVNVRIIAATNRDLEAEERAGRFRQDLRFRLAVARLTLPPLRDRPRELPMLARAFLATECAAARRPNLELSSRTMARLLAYEWPGNVRELRNAIRYAAVIAEGTVVEPWHLPDAVADVTIEESAKPSGTVAATGAPRVMSDINEEIRALEQKRMLEALEATGGHHGKAAAMIGMPRRTFATKYKSYALGQPKMAEESKRLG